jgi:cobalt-zinc-cadmium efflux system outer membrane protein
MTSIIPRHRRPLYGLGLIVIFAVMGGCAVDPGPAFQGASALAHDHTGYQVTWNQNTDDDRQAAAAVRQLLSHDLTTASAVQIALLNNPGLQATFENIGIAQADLVQAGLLRNPQFAASWRFPDRAPSQTDAEYSISQNFLDLLIIPLRKKVAAADLQRTQASVAHAVVTLVAAVKEACYRVQAQQQLISRLELIVDMNHTAAQLATRQHAAGTINDLTLANHEIIYSQSQLDLTQAHMALTADREKLTRLLGLWGPDAAWKMTADLPAIPEHEIPLDHLESLAIRQRLDFAAQRQSVEALGHALGLSEDFRYLATVTVGVSTEHSSDGQNVTGPTLDLELPIFDQGQARIARLQGQYRQARRELIQMAIDIRSDVRETRDRVVAERDLARFYGRTLLPQRIKILQLTQLQYNGMLMGVYDLILAKQNEMTTEYAYIQAWRDYWISRAQLESAVGGRLPAPAPATAPATLPTASPAPMDHSMHMNGDH